MQRQSSEQYWVRKGIDGIIFIIRKMKRNPCSNDAVVDGTTIDRQTTLVEENVQWVEMQKAILFVSTEK